MKRASSEKFTKKVGILISTACNLNIASYRTRSYHLSKIDNVAMRAHHHCWILSSPAKSTEAPRVGYTNHPISGV